MSTEWTTSVEEKEFRLWCGTVMFRASLDEGKFLTEIKDLHNEQLSEEYGRGVSNGKLEALQYTPEERERYGKWVAQSGWPVPAVDNDSTDERQP